MTNNPTQEQIDSFNKKWEERTKEQFEAKPNEAVIEYSKSLQNLTKKSYTRNEAKKIFYDKLLTVTNLPASQVSRFIKEESDYAELINLLIDLIFGFENKKLEGKGGIYIWSEPGVGKSTLMATGYNISAVLFGVALKPSVVRWQNMRNDISQKLKNNDSVDLTYNTEGNLFLDELTEKINQVSHYGDYKYSLNEIIQNRYDSWKSKGHWTVIGTNIYMDQLNPMIDLRSKTRIEEQYLIINLLGKNKRAK